MEWRRASKRAPGHSDSVPVKRRTSIARIRPGRELRAPEAAAGMALTQSDLMHGHQEAVSEPRTGSPAGVSVWECQKSRPSPDRIRSRCRPARTPIHPMCAGRARNADAAAPLAFCASWFWRIFSAFRRLRIRPRPPPSRVGQTISRRWTSSYPCSRTGN